MGNRKDDAERSISRRNFIRSTGVLTTGLGLEQLSGFVPRSTIRDHFWIFTCPPGTDDNSLVRGNIRGGSRMTPAEGAFWLNVPNLLLIRVGEDPPLPETEKWRTKSSYEQYALSFQPLDRVVWSICGSGGRGSLKELPAVLDLSGKFPNITGVYLDDFIIDRKVTPDGRSVGRPALSVQELKTVREKLSSTGRRMEIWVTLYTELLLPDHPHAFSCDPPLTTFIDLFDVITLWTWNANDLHNLEKSLAGLEAVAPGTARIALGIYIWDYPNKRPVPADLMEYQCEQGLKWLKERRIHEMIFLANTVFDVGAPGADFVREWIAEVGKRKL
jgi:hypothetical protein